MHERDGEAVSRNRKIAGLGTKFPGKSDRWYVIFCELGEPLAASLAVDGSSCAALTWDQRAEL